MCDLRKLDSCKEINHSGSIKQNVLEARELGKPDPRKEIHYDGGIKQNVSKVYESKKLDSQEEIPNVLVSDKLNAALRCPLTRA